MKQKNKYVNLFFNECILIGLGLLVFLTLKQHSETLEIIGDFVFQSELYETVFSLWMAVSFLFTLAAMYFVWFIAGLFADWATPKILAWIRRRRKEDPDDV